MNYACEIKFNLKFYTLMDLIRDGYTIIKIEDNWAVATVEQVVI